MITVCTIGHGNRSLAEFLDLVLGSGIGTLIDVRRFPRSRRHPQFNREALEAALAEIGLSYAWEGRVLGGLRDPLPGSERHTALPEDGLRAFATHMQGAEFRATIDRVLEHARCARVAILCAERDPGKCHRSLIADYLTDVGCNVLHIIGPSERREHRMHAAARREGAALVYDLARQHSLVLE
jgi:uncharacterized protein (DUF488 family)